MDDHKLMEWLTDMEARIGSKVDAVREDVIELGRDFAAAGATAAALNERVKGHHQTLYGPSGDTGVVLEVDRLAENQARNRRVFWGFFVPLVLTLAGAVAGLIAVVVKM